MSAVKSFRWILAGPGRPSLYWYFQAPLRAAMALELAAHAASGRLGFPARRVARELNMFRTMREELRRLRPAAGTPLSRLQYEEPARRLGESPTFIQILIDEWMFRRPVKYLRYARRADAASLVGQLRQCGVTLGIFSDYPAWEQRSQNRDPDGAGRVIERGRA